MKALMVTWADAVTEDAWTEMDEAVKLEPHTIFTLGFLVKENDDCIVLASSWDSEREAVCSSISIPKGWILGRQEVDV